MVGACGLGLRKPNTHHLIMVHDAQCSLTCQCASMGWSCRSGKPQLQTVLDGMGGVSVHGGMLMLFTTALATMQHLHCEEAPQNLLMTATCPGIELAYTGSDGTQLFF